MIVLSQPATIAQTHSHARDPLARDPMPPAPTAQARADRGQAARTEMVQAILPADAGARAARADLSMLMLVPGLRRNSVGPPPAFDVSYLQDLRDTLQRAPDPGTPPPDPATATGADSTDPARAGRDAPVQEAGPLSGGSEGAPAHPSARLAAHPPAGPAGSIPTGAAPDALQSLEMPVDAVATRADSPAESGPAAAPGTELNKRL